MCRVSQHGSLPTTYEEKKSFKAQLQSAAWSADEANFSEAVEFAHRVYELPKVDRFVQQVLEDPAAKQLSSTSSSFWFLVAALNRFIAHEGHYVNLPVSQDIPDMHCKTAWYVQLKEM